MASQHRATRGEQTQADRWTRENHGQFLWQLFDSGDADPNDRSEPHLTQVRDAHPLFASFQMRNFRRNYANYANQWNLSQNQQGRRTVGTHAEPSARRTTGGGGGGGSPANREDDEEHSLGTEEDETIDEESVSDDDTTTNGLGTATGTCKQSNRLRFIHQMLSSLISSFFFLTTWIGRSRINSRFTIYT